MLKFSAQELAAMVGGRLVGSGDVTVQGVSTLESAGATDLAFLRDAKAGPKALASRAAVIVTPIEIEGYAGTQVVCEDAEYAMATVLEAVAARLSAPAPGVGDRALVSPKAVLGAEVSIGDGAYVGEHTVVEDGAVVYPNVFIGRDCRIGARSVIHANCSIHDRVSIGQDCVIQYNAVIGAEGFGFIQREGKHIKLPQVGTVVIGNRVEIGALTTVDRAMLDATVIEDGTKIDNHCHIAHNCHIGPDCIMAGAAKMAGSVRLGKGVILAEDAGISDHVTVGDGAIIGARSGVHSDVAAGDILLGAPARPIAVQRRIWAVMGRLPQMAERLRALEKRLQELSARLGNAAQ